ncbi:hypothetical protein L484_009045 [Morus notabilis]|uniref:Uncharacterized protein n=1 Tax=Morus notabilis TaxID=981085 RepID=W9RB64_9ROSA|nr:hypothetical protein L484_009045 [Morus notabilis]
MLCGLGWGLRVVMGSIRNPPQTLRARASQPALALSPHPPLAYLNLNLALSAKALFLRLFFFSLSDSPATVGGGVPKISIRRWLRPADLRLKALLILLLLLLLGVVSLPARIDPLHTSAVVSLHDRLFVRVPFEQGSV